MIARGLILFSLFVLTVSAGLVCNLDPKLKEEIHSYQPVVDQIVEEVINGDFKGKLFEDLADFVDTFGPRISGSEVLEASIDDVIARQKLANLTVSTHQVQVPKWVRGDESAEIVSPRQQRLTILGLGNSGATPETGLTAEVLVVSDFNELNSRKNEVPGKIVLFNAKYTRYNETVVYRTYGPNNASALGAVAVLVRSVATFSINTPHTGVTLFDREDLVLPSAAISVENANLIARLVSRGKKVEIKLQMQAQTHPLASSRNVIGDITGKTKPDEFVVISGHIDSWDVGQGAVDDAGGAFLAWHSVGLINKLGLPRPARTLRAILWTAEELSYYGSMAYRKEREEEIKKWVVAFESDSGVFRAEGIAFSGNDQASCIMQEITSMLGAVNGTVLYRKPNVGSDVDLFLDLGVPIGEPYLAPNNYFWYHHSDGDWVDVLQPQDLDQNLAIFASSIYILADISETLPKTQVFPPKKAKRIDESLGKSGSEVQTGLALLTILPLCLTIFIST